MHCSSGEPVSACDMARSSGSQRSSGSLAILVMFHPPPPPDG